MTRNNRPSFKRASCVCVGCMTEHLLKVHVYPDSLRITDMSDTCNTNKIIPRDPLFEQHYLPADFVDKWTIVNAQ